MMNHVTHVTRSGYPKCIGDFLFLVVLGYSKRVTSVTRVTQQQDLLR